MPRSDKGPTLTALAKEARRAYGPGAVVRDGISAGNEYPWAQAYSAGDATLSVDIYADCIRDARRALMAALRALPDAGK